VGCFFKPVKLFINEGFDEEPVVITIFAGFTGAFLVELSTRLIFLIGLKLSFPRRYR